MPDKERLILRFRGLTIMTLIVSFFADIKCINWGLVKGEFVNEGIMASLYIATIGVAVISSFLYNKKIIKGVFSYPFMLSLILLFFYQCTVIFDGEPSVSLDFFIVFTIVSLMMPQFVRIDAKLFVEALMIFPSFSILRADLIFRSYLDWMDVLSMDVSYGYLVPIVANIVYLSKYFKGDSFVKKIFISFISIINLIFFFYLFLFGSRGPLLAIILLVIFLWITKVDDKGIIFNKRRGKYLFFISIFILFAFIPLVSLLNDYLLENGITVYAIDKIVNLNSEGDISNGRSTLNEISIVGFFNSPIWGNGIARYWEKSNSGLEYPHNFLLQILYDGGIMLFGLILIPAVRKTILLLKKCNNDQYVVFCTLFFASVPGALLSQDMWNIPLLWLFYGFLMSKSFVYNYEK